MKPAIYSSGRLGYDSKDTGENAIQEQEQVKVYSHTSNYSITMDRDNRQQDLFLLRQHSDDH